MLFIGLLVFFILQPFLTDTPFPVTDFVVIAVMGLICFIPFVLFVRGVASKEKANRTRGIGGA
jgi:O-antigen/teichoic acid export membrane protein